MGGISGIEARTHGFLMAVELAFDLGFPLVGMRFNALIGEFFVDLEGRLVEAELDDGEVRSGGLEVIAEAQVGELQFGLVQVGEGSRGSGSA